MSVEMVSDMESAILVMRNAGQWMKDTGKNPSKWWLLENLNPEFLLQYAAPKEFYTLFVDQKPAAAAILQFDQNAQDWVGVGEQVEALYIHWLCVHRQFAGTGKPAVVVDYATEMARQNRVQYLRADTDASRMKLRNIYESLGFHLVGIKDEDYRQTAFFEKKV